MGKGEGLLQNRAFIVGGRSYSVINGLLADDTVTRFDFNSLHENIQIRVSGANAVAFRFGTPSADSVVVQPNEVIHFPLKVLTFYAKTEAAGSSFRIIGFRE